MLDKVVQYFQKPARLMVLIFVIGVLVGWLAIGWGIWPVEYYDAGYPELREDLRYRTMENVINAYAQTGDAEAAVQSYLAFGDAAADTYNAVKTGQTVDAAVLTGFEAVLSSTGNLPEVDAAAQTEETQTQGEEAVTTQPAADAEAEVESEPVAENGALNTLGVFLGVLFVVFILIGLIAIYIFIVPKPTKDAIRNLLSRSDGVDETESPAYLSSLEPQGSQQPYGADLDTDFDEPSYQMDSSEEQPAASQEPRRSPIERTVNYAHNDLGRSHLDQSFSLKDSSGRTELEYGIQMSDYVEIAGVTYALAFDIYLASHPENRTITRVLVNRELLKHPEVLQRYEGKGEPIAIDDYHTFQLETAKYRLNGTILVANYVFDEQYGGNYLREMEADLLIHYL